MRTTFLLVSLAFLLAAPLAALCLAAPLWPVVGLLLGAFVTQDVADWPGVR